MILILLIFFLSIVPYSRYSSGQVHYFLYSFHQLDSNFLSRDWLVTQTANPHPFFSSFIALLKSFGNLPLALFGIHVLQFFFFIIGILRLCRIFSKDSRVAILVFCFLLFYFSDGLGQETIYSAIVQPADLGKLFYLFSLTALFQRKILETWIFLGLTALFDFLSGVEGSLLLLIFWAFQGRDWSRKRMAVGFSLFSLFCLPNLLPILKNFSPWDSFSSGEILKMLFNFRGPHHYRISNFELAYIFRVLFPVCFVFLAKPWVKKEKVSYRAFHFISWLLFFCFLAVASIEWFYFPTLTQLRFFRLSPFLLIVGLIFLSLTLIEEIDARQSFGAFLAVVTLALLFLEKDSRLFVPLSLFLVVFWSIRSKIPWEKMGLFQKIFLAAILLSVPAILYLARGRGVELVLDAFLGLLFLVLLKIKPNRVMTRAGLAFFLIGLPVLSFHWLFPERLSFHPIQIAPPPPLRQENPDLAEALDWIRTNTPHEALFLSPPHLDGIRFFGERAIVVDFHANPYGAREIREWKGRLEAVTRTKDLEKWVPRGGNTNPQREFLRKGYLRLGAAQVEKIARRFGADYFLTESSFPETESLARRGHPLVFNNSSYLIFRLT